MNTISIAVVDDQQLFREGLESIIRMDTELRLVLSAESPARLLNDLEQLPLLPEILIMDMRMPDMNGIELHAVLQQRFPAIKVLVVSSYDQPRFIVKMVEQGASGYLSKNTDAAELISAIKTIARNGFYFNQSMHKALQKNHTVKTGPLKSINDIPIELTNREREIIELICREYSTEAIAEQLFISVRTVEGHRQNIISKIGCKNIAGLVVFAIKKELFTLLP